jgi:hypothetical protein
VSVPSAPVVEPTAHVCTGETATAPHRSPATGGATVAGDAASAGDATPKHDRTTARKMRTRY